MVFDIEMIMILGDFIYRCLLAFKWSAARPFAKTVFAIYNTILSTPIAHYQTISARWIR